MLRSSRRLLALLLLLIGSALSLPARAADPVDSSKIKWKRTQLDEKFRSEGVAVGDFNRDGKMDIAAGSVWYEAPDWKMHLVRDKAGEFDPHGYSDSFCNFTEDLNGDGWVDLIVVDFPGKQTWWFENPKNKPGPWRRHVCVEVTNNESPQYLDLDGDGKREMLFATSADPAQPDGPDRYLALARPDPSDPYQRWSMQRISVNAAPGTNRYSHGIGAGDVNGDGRLDIVVPKGWWAAAPPAASAAAEWKFHSAPLGEDCAQMYVYDFDGDGAADVLSTSAHRLGMWWHQQKADAWQTHKISDACSQTHALEFKDINGDGLPDFITGKRWWAHGPKGDVDPNAPPVLLWFELTRQDGKPVWKEHEIDHNSGVGTQFEVADVNGDKRLDVVIANKRGVFYFEQVRE